VLIGGYILYPGPSQNIAFEGAKKNDRGGRPVKERRGYPLYLRGTDSPGRPHTGKKKSKGGVKGRTKEINIVPATKISKVGKKLRNIHEKGVSFH